jgi:tyrosyl-tRNA synthetase
VFADVPSTEVARTDLEGDGVGVVDLLVLTGIASSKGEARRLIGGGGIYLNGERVAEVDRTARIGDSIEGRVLLLRKGKKDYHVVRLTG